MPPRARATVAVLGVAALIAACSQPNETPPPSTTSMPTTATAAPKPDATPSVATPLVASVIAAPIPVPATDGKIHLAYELQLTNSLAQEVTLTSVSVRAGERTLLELPADRLSYWTRLIGISVPADKLGPAQSAVVWLDVALGKTDPIPTQLVHAVGISLAEPMPPLFPATMTETIAPVTVQTRKAAVIAAPLDGANWLDGSSCCDMTAHRTALNPINGQLWAAERFAVDYVQLGPDGRLFVGDKGKLESYPYFGADIRSRNSNENAEILTQVMPEDLITFGLIPEFVGRLPVVSAVHQLTRDDLVEILTEPKNALVRQYQRFFGYDSIELVFTDDALWEIADHALARETGARGLRSIIELALLDVMFELPSRTDVTKCVLTKETITRGQKPTLVTSGAAAVDDELDEIAEESA